MFKIIEIEIPPEFILEKKYIYEIIARRLKFNKEEITAVIPIRRSLDARARPPIYRLLCNVYINERALNDVQKINYYPVKGERKAAVIGFGPAGIFASLRLLELGIKPVIFERGKSVRERRKDIKRIYQNRIIDPNSNYCFGEGGAGAFSDGKLFTRSTKRGDVKKILRILTHFGADKDILLDSRPHIGSNLLPKIIEAIREEIIKNGGEIRFNSCLTDLTCKNLKIKSIIINDKIEYNFDAVILATGHSARDVYYLMRNKGFKLQAKPFALGVRVEHPQQLINKVQYREYNKYLPPAEYSLSCQIGGKGVYSFCMCPGGTIIPASTRIGELSLNGMSSSKRNLMFSNSGVAVTVDEADWKEFSKYEEFAGLEYQKWIERKCFEGGGADLKAPAQRIVDLVNNRISNELPQTSYLPGLNSVTLNSVLPNNIVKALIEAFKIFNKKMPGFISDEAIALAPESRTSAPIRIPRNRDNYTYGDIKGLFPCGEGAGYAGGIVSAAIDGENCATAAAKYI